MSDELTFHINALTRLIFFQTEEEDRLLNRLRALRLQRRTTTLNISVYNSTMGLQKLDDVVADWETRKLTAEAPKTDIHGAFNLIYSNIEEEASRHIYVITDPDRWLADLQVQRRILNLVHSMNNTSRGFRKTIIFVGPRRIVPEKLARYMEVVVDPGPTEVELQQAAQLPINGLRADAKEDIADIEDPSLYKGLSTWEAQAVTMQSIHHFRVTTGVRRVDPGYIQNYRRKILKKSDLLSYVDTDDVSFRDVGGLQRFKEWVDQTKACWTPEGRAFGLKPPKGVLAVGVWGCGKSLSVQAMGQAWGIPIVRLELGKLRSSNLGGSEANVYAALSMIERLAPVIVFVDEADKSFSGGQSSAQTDGGTTNRMLGIFSTWLQDTKAPVTLALTANNVGMLPIELINRMDERFFFDLPSVKDRIDILKIHLLKIHQVPSRFDLAALAEKADKLVGREIAQAVDSALRLSFHQVKTLGLSTESGLDEEILAKELATKPRILKTMGDEVSALLTWVGFDAEANDGIRARFAASPNREAANSSMKIVE